MNVIINRLSWAQAVSLAIEAGRIYGQKQSVFKDRRHGWTWREVGQNFPQDISVNAQVDDAVAKGQPPF
jgi:hypothetical protein